MQVISRLTNIGLWDSDTDSAQKREVCVHCAMAEELDNLVILLGLSLQTALVEWKKIQFR